MLLFVTLWKILNCKSLAIPRVDWRSLNEKPKKICEDMKNQVFLRELYHIVTCVKRACF